MAIPIFSGENYDHWALKMRAIIIGSGLGLCAEYVIYDSPDGRNKRENARNDAAALFIIKRGVSPKILPKIIHATKAKEAWDILKKEFQGTSKVPLPTRRRDRLAPRGTKREKALLALTAAAYTTTITKFICEGVEKLSHHYDDLHDGSLESSSDDLFEYSPPEGLCLGHGSLESSSDDLFEYSPPEDLCLGFEASLQALGNLNDGTTLNSFAQGICNMFSN